MPSYVILEKCDGCKGQDKTACQHICPNDLMVLNTETMKAWNREPEMCWECPDLPLCGGGCRIEREAQEGVRVAGGCSSGGCSSGGCSSGGCSSGGRGGCSTTTENGPNVVGLTLPVTARRGTGVFAE